MCHLGLTRTGHCSLLGVLLFCCLSNMCQCALTAKSWHDSGYNNVTSRMQIQLPREDGAEGEDMDTDDQVAQATSSNQVGISWLSCVIHYTCDTMLNP